MIIVLIILGVALIEINCEPNALPKHIFPCGRQIPSIGLGTRSIGNDIRGLTSFLAAIDNGYRVFDTAAIFDNKQALGMAIKQNINAKRITRKDVFVMSKVWNTNHKRIDVVHSMQSDARDLDIEELDAGLLHFPTSFEKNALNKSDLYPKSDNGAFKPFNAEKDKGYLEAYRGLEAALLLKFIGHIGLSNVNIAQMKKILDIAFIRPVILQIECNPLFKNEKLIDFAKRQNMTVICAAPLRQGTKELSENSVLKEIADKHKKNVQQVALRWNMQRGTVVIPDSGDKKHQHENLESLEFELDGDDIKKINDIPQANRTIDIPGLESHPDYPFGADSDKE